MATGTRGGDEGLLGKVQDHGSEGHKCSKRFNDLGSHASRRLRNSIRARDRDGRGRPSVSLGAGELVSAMGRDARLEELVADREPEEVVLHTNGRDEQSAPGGSYLAYNGEFSRSDRDSREV